MFAWQFVDFLPVLPAERLRPGLEWTDGDTANPARDRFTRATRCRVARDTVADGLSAFVVETESRLAVRRIAAVGEELSIRTQLEGTGCGRLIFAPAPGLLLRRERQGTLAGTETCSLGDSPRAVSHTREYPSTIQLLPGRVGSTRTNRSFRKLRRNRAKSGSFVAVISIVVLDYSLSRI